MTAFLSSATLLAAMLLPYSIVIGLCAVAVRRRAHSDEEGRGNGAETVSVVICVSHEDVTELDQCVNSLSRALRDGDEAIIVTDHAKPATVSWLQEAARTTRGSVFVVRNEGEKGKKAAQAQGVALAKSRIVMSVDADCKFWGGCVDAVRQAAPTSGDFLLLLPVMMEGGQGLWGAMVEMEFVCLQVVTAGTAILKRPTMANGAGMAFSRGMFVSHDSKSRYASGDDMFLLLHAIRRGALIRFVCRGETLIRTAAPHDIGAYLRQRTRWLAKAGGYPSSGGSYVTALALIVLAAVMAWPAMVAIAAAGAAPWWLAAVAFIFKLLVDLAAFVAGRGLWPSRAPLVAALPLEALYPLMTIVVATRAAFANKKRW